MLAHLKTLRPTHKTNFSIFPIIEHCSPIQDKKQLKCGQLHPLVGTRFGKRLDELDSETGEWIPGNELGEDWLYFVLLIFSLSLRGEMSDPSVCLSLTIDNWVDKLTGYTFRSMALQPLRGVATVGTFRIILLIAVTRFQTRKKMACLETCDGY